VLRQLLAKFVSTPVARVCSVSLDSKINCCVLLFIFMIRSTIRRYGKLKEEALDRTVENLLWKRLRNCRKTDYTVNECRQKFDRTPRTAVRVKHEIILSNGRCQTPDWCKVLHEVSRLTDELFRSALFLGLSSLLLLQAVDFAWRVTSEIFNLKLRHPFVLRIAT
jgi:hypothetical protein